MLGCGVERCSGGAIRGCSAWGKLPVSRWMNADGVLIR